MINPEIQETSGSITWEEGCLSFPGLYQDVERAEYVRVEATDRNGERYELEAEGILAVAIQHEVDHLDGILFLERMSPLKRRLARKDYKKIRARMAEETSEEAEA